MSFTTKTATQERHEKTIEKRNELLATHKAYAAFNRAQEAFALIKKIWNVKADTIDEINKIINHSINKEIETVENILKKNTQAIPSTEIIHLTTTIKNLKTTYSPITAHLSPHVITTLKKIFNSTKNIYKKLLESEDVVQKYNASAEIIGYYPPYKNLSEIFLITLAGFIKDYNNAPGVKPLPLNLQQTEAEKKADQEIENLTKQLSVNHLIMN